MIFGKYFWSFPKEKSQNGKGKGRHLGNWMLIAISNNPLSVAEVEDLIRIIWDWSFLVAQ